MAELILSMLQTLIYDITDTAVQRLFDKRRLKYFLKELDRDVRKFCEVNESGYINSGAFDFFIRGTDFLRRVIGRAIATKLEKSNKEFLQDEIIRAKEIAVAEGADFSTGDERMIKDLYSLIVDSVGKYFNDKLTIEQRHIVSLNLDQLTELREAVNSFHKESSQEHRELLKAIKEEGKFNNTKASLIADLLSKNLIEGRFQEFDDLATVVKDKSDDLEIFYECLSSILRLDNCSYAVQRILDIGNTRIRDTAVRTALPILVFRKEPIDMLIKAATAESLHFIVDSVVSGTDNGIFSDEITFENGLEIHNFSLNRKSVCEEENLVKAIAILSLYDRPIRNIYLAMEKIGNGINSWFIDVLIADKRIDGAKNNNVDDDFQLLKAELNHILKYKVIYDGVCKRIRSFYYSVVVKAYLIMNNIEEAEKFIPDDLVQERPLSDFVYAIRNAKREVELREIYEYSKHNETYWLLNNYFISRKNEKELVDFCRNHEDIFPNDWPLFFMYQGALKVLGLNSEREKQLKKHADDLKNVYEYWNEVLNLSDSEENQKNFVKACSDGKMTVLLQDSIYFLIERLINFHEYNLAELYLTNQEKTGEKGFRIKKYKAIILQGKNNDVEALRWYRAAFEDNRTDVYVIDSLITLSLINNRKVDKEIIDAAIKANTSRLHMLVAACYLNDGDISKAKSENLRAVLMSGEGYNPAFGQYIFISSSEESKEVVKISVIEADTAAYCKKVDGGKRWICVHKDYILPTSPYFWNNDYHVHIDDAARLSFLRKHIGDKITLDNESYEIIEIMPIDCYLFRTCMAKMSQHGLAKQVLIPVKDGKLDVAAFTELLTQSSLGERSLIDWLKQYNNIQDVPMPLYVYKRFTRLPYFQFVDMILTSHDYFVRQIIHTSKRAKKYVLTFSTLVALYKAGYPAERIGAAGGNIIESTLVQVESDVTEIINEYNRDTVASLGVIDGKLFYNQVDDAGKDYWLKEAGSFKKYVESIPIVKSDNDLSGEFFGAFDSKEIFGICDYDAISFVQHNDEYSLVAIEAILVSLAQNEMVNLSVISVSDWLVEQETSVDELLGYLKALLDEGCLLSITKEVITYIFREISKVEDDTKNRLYSIWDGLLSNVDRYSDTHKIVFIQGISEVFASLKNNIKDINQGVFRILTNNILLLRKQKLEVFLNEDGYLSFALVNDEQEDTKVEIDDP